MQMRSTITAVFAVIGLGACQNADKEAPKPDPAKTEASAIADKTKADPHGAAAHGPHSSGQPNPHGGGAEAPPAVPLVGGKHPSEVHFTNVVQLTTGGENAEAYWSYDNKKLIYQAHEGEGCDQIYVRDAFAPAGTPEATPKLVSTGQGTTTCAYFLPGDKEIIYASTHLASPACPPKADQSKGYVWSLYAGFDIFRANADGTNLRRLTEAPGYDAEGTVCPKDGSIVFTSVRDGDLELYRMDADGKNVKRLTQTPGYDGGAFFSTDCKKIVWRASRPTGEALAEFNKLLGEGLVRPTKLELYVADADGSNAKQVTTLGVAAFGPYFYPGSERIIFSSNNGDPRGREFDLWAINVDGTALERITHTPGFDGFPMFSHDGKSLVFASNRVSKPGTWDTNLFVTGWSNEAPANAPAAVKVP
jgi:Tol biopolymer transport system component